MNEIKIGALEREAELWAAEAEREELLEWAAALPYSYSEELESSPAYQIMSAYKEAALKELGR